MMVQCQCGQKYNIKESLYGKVVRCRKCGNNMQVGYPEQQVAVEPLPSQAAPQHPPQPQPAPPQPQQPAYDPNAFGDLSDSQMSVGSSPYASQFPARPVPGKRPATKRIRYDFSKVNLGLRLIFGGTVSTILCMFAFVGFAVAGVPPLALLMLFGAVIGAFVSTAGYILCIFVPVETMARPLIIGAVVCSGINTLCSIANAIMNATEGAESIVLSILGAVMQAASITLFLMFLKKVAHFVDNPGAAHDAHSLLIFYWIVVGVCFGFGGLIIALAITAPPIATAITLIIGGIGMLVTWIIWFIHFMAFINDLEFKRSTALRKSRRW